MPKDLERIQKLVKTIRERGLQTVTLPLYYDDIIFIRYNL